MAQQATIHIEGHDATHVLTTAFFTSEDYEADKFATALQRKIYDCNGTAKTGGTVGGWHELKMSVQVSGSPIMEHGDRYGTRVEVRYALSKGAEPHEIDYEILFVIDQLVEDIKSARLQKDLLDLLA